MEREKQSKKVGVRLQNHTLERTRMKEVCDGNPQNDLRLIARVNSTTFAIANPGMHSKKMADRLFLRDISVCILHAHQPSRSWSMPAKNRGRRIGSSVPGWVKISLRLAE